MTKLGPAHIARHRDYSNPDKGETCVMFAIREIQGDNLLSSKLQFMDGTSTPNLLTLSMDVSMQLQQRSCLSSKAQLSLFWIFIGLVPQLDLPQ